ncbi:acetoacetate decarboxylase family protein [Tsukamurella sp. 8F]|uniref:acetoacetate decarboxylase family protein n=1 Tax=unclassified Tsukamurella TaxID=2633480 RepID=UPI0023B92898|nr:MULTISPECIES: acetoacetate decarboxylase family protein [unclassified Tsukamurella]MDF0531820.1 acetoacetate decarboxylase family protein [Tsukamurella sp. 8J]MDF0589062.1 acetoacetate decarboxylase family protein [Tsukamurella sp. 8F]
MTARADFARVRALLRTTGPTYRDAHYLTTTVEVDPAAMRPWLPGGVHLADPPRADLFCAWFPDNAFQSPYREAGLFVHVRTPARTGIHTPWMIVDDDIALIVGREALGYPKKIGEITFTVSGDDIEARAGRRGAELIHMHGELGEHIEEPYPILGRPNLNATGLIGAAIPRLVLFRPGEHPIETRRAHLTLTLGGTPRDPLHEMGLGEVVDARLHRVDLTRGIPPFPVRPLSPRFIPRRFVPRIL